MLSGIRYPVSGIRYPVFAIRYPVSGIRYPVSAIRYPVSAIRYPLSGIRYPVSGFSTMPIQDAITRSEYKSINLKPKQVVCLEALFNNKDTLAVLPTGYGKSLLYKVLPVLLAERNTRLPGWH